MVVTVVPGDISKLEASLKLCIETLNVQREALASYEKTDKLAEDKIRKRYQDYLDPLINLQIQLLEDVV